MVGRGIFARVPRSDAYALAAIAASPELGGTAGVRGITRPGPVAPRGPYPASGPGVGEALLGSLATTAGGALLLLAGLALVAAALASRGSLGQAGPPRRSA